MTLPMSRSLLEGITKLQYAQIVTVTTDNLNTDGQTGSCKPAWHRQCRAAHSRDVIAGLHPIDIGQHLLPVDFRWIGLIHIERQDLAYRQNQEFIVLHELAHAME